MNMYQKDNPYLWSSYSNNINEQGNTDKRRTNYKPSGPTLRNVDNLPLYSPGFCPDFFE